MKKSARQRKSRIGGLVAAIALPGGSVVVGGTVAQAAPPQGCSMTAGVPYRSGDQITGSGRGDCNTSAQRTWKYEIHRSEGWWHPTVTFASWSGNRASYWGSAHSCDPGSGSGTRQYFGQSFFEGYDATLSGNSRELAICD